MALIYDKKLSQIEDQDLPPEYCYFGCYSENESDFFGWWVYGMVPSPILLGKFKTVTCARIFAEAMEKED